MGTVIDPVACGFVAFLVFVGAGWRVFIQSRGLPAIPLGARLYGWLTTQVLLTSLGTFALGRFNWSPLLVGPLGLVLALVTSRILTLWLNFIDQQVTFSDLLKRIIKILNALEKITSNNE